MKQGIVQESNKEYHGYTEAISKSRLSRMSICPSYFKWYEENPQAPTEDLIIGSAFHKLTLEDYDFDNEFIISRTFDRRTAQGKQDYADFMESANDKQVINQDQYEMIKGMKESILSNKYAKVLIQGKVETSMYDIDESTQEQIKARPDVFSKIGDRIIITDLKSCRSAISEDVIRDVCKYSYDLQAYMYRLILSKVMNVPIDNVDFVFIFVEKKPPYLINIMQADTYVLQRGEQLFRKYIGQYHECKESNNWYGLNGAYDIINNLSLPNYLMNKND